MSLNGAASAGLVCLLTASIGFAQISLPSEPVFTYLSGPHFCAAEYGYAVPAFCTSPGELPLGSFPVPDINGSYVDPNFGATVRVLTEAALDSVHQYSVGIQRHRQICFARHHTGLAANCQCRNCTCRDCALSRLGYGIAQMERRR